MAQHGGRVRAYGKFTGTPGTGTVTNATMADMATKTYKGRTTAGTGSPEDVPVATVLADLSAIAAANFDWNGKKIINLAAGTAAGDGVRWEQSVGLVAAAGDALFGSAAGTLVKRAAGTNGQLLAIDTAQTDKHDHIDMPWDQNIVPWAMAPFAQTGTSTVVGSGVLAGGYVETASTIGQSMSWKVWLSAGTWSLGVTYRTQSNAGIADATLDGTALGSIDQYSAGAVNNVQTTIASIVVATSGPKVLTFTTATKNGSSSAFIFRAQHIALRRTA